MTVNTVAAPDATVTTNPLVKYMEENYTNGRKIASFLDLSDGYDESHDYAPATITIRYTDGPVEVIVIDQTLEAFINTAYNFA